MKLIIQIPAYDEEATIAATLAALPKKVPPFTTIETLLIDDGSSDRTVEVAKAAGVDHVVRLISHRGLAKAFAAGIDASLRLGADVIVNTDADNQYRAQDIQKLVEPIVQGSAELVIGDRDVKNSAHMGPVKRLLQRLGSWAVGRAAGLEIPDVTSGFRAFSREAAYQINVFNPFTYTLETIIQAGDRNLGVRSVTVGTNPPTRPSRLYSGMFRYVRKSVVTIFRVYTVYKPLKTFFAFGLLIFLLGVALGARFLWFWATDGTAGHIQSLILAAVFLIVGFQTALIGLVADLISVNRRLSEDILVRLRKLDPQIAMGRTAGGSRRDRGRDREKDRDRDRGGSPQKPAREPQPSRPPETQWVWLLDETKFEGTLEEPVPAAAVAAAPPAEPAPAGGGGRRRRRRRRSEGRPPVDARDRKHPHPRIQKDEDEH